MWWAWVGVGGETSWGDAWERSLVCHTVSCTCLSQHMLYINMLYAHIHHMHTQPPSHTQPPHHTPPPHTTPRTKPTPLVSHTLNSHTQTAPCLPRLPVWFAIVAPPFPLCICVGRRVHTHDTAEHSICVSAVSSSHWDLMLPGGLVGIWVCL